MSDLAKRIADRIVSDIKVADVAQDTRVKWEKWIDDELAKAFGPVEQDPGHWCEFCEPTPEGRTRPVDVHK